jgi:hypothetical protein
MSKKLTEIRQRIGGIMAKKTEVETSRLDELWINTTSEIDTSKLGHFTQHMAHLIEVDDLSAAYLHACADVVAIDINHNMIKATKCRHIQAERYAK